MTPAKSADQGVEAGDVFVEGIEETGVRGFGFCEQRRSPVLQSRKRLPKRKCSLLGQRMAVRLILNEIRKSKMEILGNSHPLYSAHLTLDTLQRLAKIGGALAERDLGEICDEVYGNGYEGEQRQAFEERLNHPFFVDFERNLVASNRSRAWSNPSSDTMKTLGARFKRRENRRTASPASRRG